MKILTLTAAILGLTSAKVFLDETFSDGEGWKDRWTPSSYRSDLGSLEVSPGKWFADEASSMGLRTTEDYRFYAVSTKIQPFSNKDKNLVIQFDVKNEQDIDCGGSYLKFFGEEFDPKTFNGDSEYNIMFGPDICGSKSLVHAIFHYKGQNHDLKKTVTAPTDTLSHTYTLIVKPDQTYEILIDSESKVKGSLLVDWDFLPPQEIQDPKVSKPEDWVDEAEIENDLPLLIVDPAATKPEDWDDEMDGEWEAPMVANPEHKKIPNPLYKGEWVHPMVVNPDYKADPEIYVYQFSHVGLDIWQVKSGTIFDNILITDDLQVALDAREKSKAIHSKEQSAKNAFDDQKEAERIVREEKKTKEADEQEILEALEDVSQEAQEAQEANLPAKDEL
ncbi:hypothetical protein G6F56_003342 [Rhizopus delemar]|uniref:Calreticulin n=1 Tax=Rhizopus stolonifer TaxID=4846 RepID=A0A367K662_RHIST|nr:hypothetical protein G6F56_003342 [Rhizopus delemar]RCH97704.1 calreticulin 3 [Rhizopus stolonifer]